MYHTKARPIYILNKKNSVICKGRCSEILLGARYAPKTKTQSYTEYVSNRTTRICHVFFLFFSLSSTCMLFLKAFAALLSCFYWYTNPAILLLYYAVFFNCFPLWNNKFLVPLSWILKMISSSSIKMLPWDELSSSVDAIF